ANEEVQEALSKSDYGERVHRCLEAFHQKVDWLSAPFKEVVTEKNRESAIATLEEISQQVFSKDLDDSFEHSGWLAQWLKLIPEYINWQIKNASEWQFYEAELKSKVAWQKDTELGGRLDRLDKNESGLSVIDYKTGKSATLAEIEQGEAVQLPFYALLAENELKQSVDRVSYLTLSNTVKFGAQLSGDELETISQQIGDRLTQIIDEMSDGKALTAWGDESTCQYCNINRLCRKQAWNI
ncbi:MAG: PD-(D/E)XK nuclease family protein, partial [Gammaproteobacteria bacterium]|nr:PD-(D/E)XK nuclease family protein [Gammaproteobacteria bacterium]